MRTTSAKLTVTMTKYAPRTLNDSLPIRYPQRPATAVPIANAAGTGHGSWTNVWPKTSTSKPTAASALA